MKAGNGRARTNSLYVRQLLDILDRYVAETGNDEIDMNQAAAWALSQGLMEPRRDNVIRQMARSLARASRQDYIENESGLPVRVRHPYRVQKGEKQEVFWFKMEDATPEKMLLSTQQRRKGIQADVFQADRDVKYFDKHYNPGDPLQVSWNFDLDVADAEHSSEYDDTPPADNQEFHRPDSDLGDS